MTPRLQWLALPLVLGSNTVTASAATSALSVSATVSLSCTITTSPVNFGRYDPASRLATDAVGKLTISCTDDAFSEITLDPGSHPSTPGNVATRRMKQTGRSDHLAYALFLDGSRTTVWGISPNSISPPAKDVGQGMTHDYPVYGRIPTGLYVASGFYTDTVIATVTWH